MYYLVTVCDDKMVLEKIRFDNRYSALAHVERRRKQGYIVTIKLISFLEPDKYYCKGE